MWRVQTRYVKGDSLLSYKGLPSIENFVACSRGGACSRHCTRHVIAPATRSAISPSGCLAPCLSVLWTEGTLKSGERWRALGRGRPLIGDPASRLRCVIFLSRRYLPRGGSPGRDLSSWRARGVPVAVWSLIYWSRPGFDRRFCLFRSPTLIRVFSLLGGEW